MPGFDRLTLLSLLAGGLLLFSTSCERAGVGFTVTSERPISAATMELNDELIAMNLDAGSASGNWTGPDASGVVRVKFSDGEEVLCKVDYVTHGMEDQLYRITANECELGT